MLNGMGLKTGVDLDKLIKTAAWKKKKVQHPLPAHVSKAGNFTL